MNRFLPALAFLAFTCSTPAQTLNLETNNLVMQSVALCPYGRTFDGQWLGTTVASDGCCYFGSSTHDSKHGGGFFRFNPATQTTTMLAEDLTAVCQENVRFTPPQGKLHSDIVEYDGWLYFSTHLGNYWTEAENAYTGGHVIGYQLASGNFRDFGVIRSNYTCYAAVGVDKVRNKLLSFVTRYWGSPQDSHIYRIDISTGAKQDLGVVPGYTCFWFFVDLRGDCWFTCEADNGSLRVIRSATGAMETYSNVLPEAGLGSARFWDWAKALPDGNTCVFKLFNGNYLYSFRADVFATNHAAAFSTLRNIGPAPSGLALGPDRVYYVQRANRQPGHQEYKDFHLMSVPIYTNSPILDHGLIMDQSGRLVWRLPGLAADTEGTVYGVGDWWLLPGEQGTVVGTLRHEDRNASSNYYALPRGQFFARINLSPTLSTKQVLSASTAGGGTIATDPPASVFPQDAVVNLSATPASNSIFLGWSGDVEGTHPTNSLVMTRDKSVQAVFGAAITAVVIGNGSVSVDPPGGVYPYGLSVQLAAVPQPGHFFSTWDNGALGNINPLTYIVTNGNSTVSATFSVLPPGNVSFAALTHGNGRVEITPKANIYNAGQGVTLSAIPDPGQTFLGWSGMISGTNNPVAMVLSQSGEVTAHFSQDPFLEMDRIDQTASPEITFSGALGVPYRIDASTNLSDWLPLGVLTNRFGCLRFTDPSAGVLPQRFYRAVSP